MKHVLACCMTMLTLLLWHIPTWASDDPIRIGVILPITGLAAGESEAVRNAVLTALHQANEKKTVPGRSIEVIELDNMSTTIGSKLAAEQAVAADVLAVVGPMWSSHAMAMAPVLQKAGVVMIGITTTAPEVTQVGDYIFRACFTDTDQIHFLAAFARQERTKARAAILHIADDVYSQGLANLFAKRFTQLGGQIVGTEAYLLDAVQHDRQLNALAAKKPDVLFVPGYSMDSTLIVHQARSMGLDILMLGADGWTSPAYPLSQSRHGENYYISHWHKDIPSPESQAFLELMTSQDPLVMKTFHFDAACGFDAANLILEAVRRAKSADRTAVRDALAGIKDFKGLTGTITFGPNRNPIKPMVLTRLSPEGAHMVRVVIPEVITP